jgi:nucleoside-diphosphate-sugar epimerase
MPRLLETGTVAVVGGSGFVGGAVAARVGGLGFDVRRLAAPRVTYTPETRQGRVDRASIHSDLVDAFAEKWPEPR